MWKHAVLKLLQKCLMKNLTLTSVTGLEIDELEIQIANCIHQQVCPITLLKVLVVGAYSTVVYTVRQCESIIVLSSASGVL